LRVVLKNLVKKCLEMFAEAFERKEDCKYSCEQFGTCVNLGIHEHPTNRKFAELFQVSASKSGVAKIEFEGVRGSLEARAERRSPLHG